MAGGASVLDAAVTEAYKKENSVDTVNEGRSDRRGYYQDGGSMMTRRKGDVLTCLAVGAEKERQRRRDGQRFECFK